MLHVVCFSCRFSADSYHSRISSSSSSSLCDGTGDKQSLNFDANTTNKLPRKSGAPATKNGLLYSSSSFVDSCISSNFSSSSYSANGSSSGTSLGASCGFSHGSGGANCAAFVPSLDVTPEDQQDPRSEGSQSA